MSAFATKEQLINLASFMASQINVPTIGVGGGYAPIGTIISYMGTVAPADFLICDGTSYNITDYPQLANFFETQFGSKNYFGGNGTTTFAVPDLRGEFLRGSGTNSHTNQGSGTNIGTHQDATAINIGWANNSVSGFSREDYTSSADYTELIHTKNVDSAYSLGARKTNISSSYFKSATSTGADEWVNTVRPTNTSVLYCIKAKVAGESYSTDEQVIGTWIDGKPLYQKTFTGTTPSASGALNISITNMNILCKMEGFITSGVKIALQYKDASNVFAGYGVSSGLEIWCDGSAVLSKPYAITVRYTKTTD